MLRSSSVSRPRFQPQLEVLEDRLAPAGYTVTALGAPSGYSSFQADAINASGQILGQATAPSGATETFLYSNGQWADLGVPSSYGGASPIAINNSGQVLATTTLPNNTGIWITHALLYRNGQWTDLGTPSGTANYRIDGLDDAGQVLTDAIIGSGASAAEHLFLYSNGQWTDLAVPGGPNYEDMIYQINDSGQVLATGSTGSGASAVNTLFLYSNGQWTDLGAPSGISGSHSVIDAALNNSGQVVITEGIAIYPTPSPDGNTPDWIMLQASPPFLYSNGHWAELSAPGGYANPNVAGIDDAGEILLKTMKGYDSSVLLYSGGHWADLDNLLPLGITVNSPWSRGTAINANGQILVTGSDGQSYLLTPQQTTSAATTTTLNVSSANVPAGQAVTLTATVSGPGVSAPLGSVTFFDGSIALGTVMLTDGTASLTTTLPVGSNNITALYNGFALGNFIYQSSISTAQTVTVSSPSGNGGSTPPTKIGSPVAEPVSMPAPVGGLSLLGFGFTPGWQPDVFEVDQAGQVFAMPLLSFFEGTARPTFVNNDVALSNTQLFEGGLVSFLHGSNGQPYLMDLLTANTTYLAEAMADAALHHL
jgi:probable HAF family extracellular repeat protein